MKDLSIIVPVYNEERTLRDIMTALQSACAEAQHIYVDDGSKDGSLRIMREHARPNDIVVTKPNGGKGSAVRMGLEHASGDYIVIQDADLEYDPAQIRSLHDEAVKTRGIVFGSRFLESNPNLYKRYLMGNKAVTFAFNVLFGTRLTDSYTCYKLFPADIMRSFPLKARGFELEAELCAFPAKRRLPIREIPIEYRPRSLEEGKKIRFADAWKGVRRMIEIRCG